MYRIHPPLSYVGIYQPETFKRESKYGLTVLTTTDEGLLKYLHQIMSQMETWLVEGRHVLFLANPINYYFGTSSRLSFSTCIAFIPHSPT